MMKSIFYFLITSLLLTSSTPVFAQNYLDIAGLSPYTKYKTFETEHFKFTYQEGYFDFAERAAVHIEHAHEVLSPILKWQPRYKTDVLIADNEDSENGSTMPALRVGIVLIATPPDGWSETAYSDNWIKLLVFHEYTHFLNIDATHGFMEAARIFFGDIIRPNGLWPVWMLEGLAVYYETRTSILGRGRSPYYDSVIRAYLNENRLDTHDDHGITLDRINGHAVNDPYPYFPGGDVAYLFGYHMWDEFSKDHAIHSDTDSAMGEYSYNSSFRIPYLIEGNLTNVMGHHWIDYWDSFVKDSKTRLGKQIDQVKKAGETKFDLLTHAQFSSLLGDISPDGQWLAYSETSLDDQPRLVLINLKTKESRRLEEKTLGVGMSFTPDSKNLIYSSLIRTDTYSLFSELLIYDIEHHKTYSISNLLRAKDPSLSADGKRVTFIRSEKATNFLCTANLVFKDGKYELSDTKTVYEPSQFAILSHPHFLKNGEIVLSSQEIGQAEADLVIANESGKTRVFLADGAMNRTPVAKGDKVYFISDRSGIENMYSISENGGTPTSLTNTITSITFPGVAPDGTLYGSLLTSSGYEIARFSDITARPQLEKIGNPSAPEPLANALTEPTLKFYERDSVNYSPWSSMAPRQWAPVELINYNSYSGLTLSGSLLGFDTTGKHQYIGYAAYNFTPKTVDGSFTYTYYGFRPVISLSGSSLTTDIATDQDHDQYRNTSEVLLSFSFPIRYTYSSLTPSVYTFVDWNRVYDLYTKAQLPNDDFEYSNPLVPGVGGSLVFSDAETTPLGFMSEEGNNVTLAAEDRVNVGHYSVMKYMASYEHFFDLGEHNVLAPKYRFLGSTYPTGFDRAYARVQGKNTYDITDEGEVMNLDRIGVRGYSNEVVYTRQTMVASLDYNFPIFVPFTGYNTLPFFLRQVHGFVFAESAYIPSSSYPNLFLPSFGGGLRADTQFLIQLPIQVSVEVQNGTNKTFGGDTLVFLSLSSASLF
jgi:hypothetical protein